MALRRSSAYSSKTTTPYTRRSKLKGKSYIKTVPPQGIVKFRMGSEKDYFAGKFPFVLRLVPEKNIQIRSNALEASRQFVNKALETRFVGQYFFKVVPYPHHIQRENKMLTGAGADRMQKGMQLAFGKAIARAALVKSGEPIFLIASQTKKVDQAARALLYQITSKIPGKKRIISEEIKAGRTVSC